MNFIVEKSKWLRNIGNKLNYVAVLCTEKGGRMCCLGFCAIQSGVPEDSLIRVPLPGDIYECQKYPKMRYFVKKIMNLSVEVSDSRLSFLASEINDDAKTTDDQKIAKLKSLFKKYRHTIEFVD